MNLVGKFVNKKIKLNTGKIDSKFVGASSDELLLTEMLFTGVFGTLTASQSCALLSCMVCDERNSQSPKLSEELAGPLRQMQVSPIFLVNSVVLLLINNFFIKLSAVLKTGVSSSDSQGEHRSASASERGGVHRTLQAAHDGRGVCVVQRRFFQ